MADICKCTNDKCPIKEQCYRWTAEDEDLQAYSHFSPDEKGYCSMQIELKSRRLPRKHHITEGEIDFLLKRLDENRELLPYDHK